MRHACPAQSKSRSSRTFRRLLKKSMMVCLMRSMYRSETASVFRHRRWEAAEGNPGGGRQVIGFRRAMLVTTFSVLLAAQSGPAADDPGAPVDVARAGRHLSEALQIRTVAQGEHGASAETVQAFRAFLERRYPAAHRVMSRDFTPNDGTLYTWRGRDARAAPILLIAHLDVVPAEEQGDVRWQHPAFAGTIADGAVWGRGAIDMKGQLIGIFEAIEMLAEQGYVPERTILVGLSTGEEAAGRSAESIASLMASRGLRPDFVLDEGPVVVDPFEMTDRRAAFIGVAEKGYGTLLVTPPAGAASSSASPGRRRCSGCHRRSSRSIICGLMDQLDAHARAMLAALAPNLAAWSVWRSTIYGFRADRQGAPVREDAGWRSSARRSLRPWPRARPRKISSPRLPLHISTSASIHATPGGRARRRPSRRGVDRVCVGVGRAAAPREPLFGHAFPFLSAACPSCPQAGRRGHADRPDPGLRRDRRPLL